MSGDQNVGSISPFSETQHFHLHGSASLLGSSGFWFFTKTLFWRLRMVLGKGVNVDSMIEDLSNITAGQSPRLFIRWMIAGVTFPRFYDLWFAAGGQVLVQSSDFLSEGKDHPAVYGTAVSLQARLSAFSWLFVLLFGYMLLGCGHRLPGDHQASFFSGG